MADLIILRKGRRFAKLRVIRRHGLKGSRATWECLCDCGSKTVVTGKALRNGTTISCGCQKNAERGTADISKRTFGRLKPIRVVGKNERHQWLWECRCKCGNTIIVPPGALKSGNTQSCGCRKNEMIGNRSRTHGASRSPEYNNWISMKSRCGNPNNQDYDLYGGRGIRVCARWIDSFEAFLADMGKRPAPRMTVERIETDGNYEPDNCRWATQKEQTRNKRNNRIVTYKGLSLSVGEWAEKLGLPFGVIHHRLQRKWPLSKVLNPKRFRKAK